MPTQPPHPPIIIGAGPSGLITAILLAEARQDCLLIERQRFPGGKLPVTGGGHCNLTHRGTAEELAPAYHEQARLMKRVLLGFGPEDLRAFFRERGLKTFYDEKDCCYPNSLKAEDVVLSLYKAALKSGVRLALGYELKRLDYAPETESFRLEIQNYHGKQRPSKWPRMERIENLVARQEESRLPREMQLESKTVVLATGSPAFYRSDDAPAPITQFPLFTGLTVPFRPALNAPQDPQFAALSGVSLEDASLTLLAPSGKILAQERGTLLFTHRGLSGPLALNFSRHRGMSATGKKREEGAEQVVLDLCPALTDEEVQLRLERGRAEQGHLRIAPRLIDTLPKSIWPFLMAKAGLNRDLRFADCSKQEARALITVLKRLPLNLAPQSSLEPAMLARGGFMLSALKAKTLAFKDYPGLYACGECLDIDGRSGGYNLQAAFATGYRVAQAILKERR